MSQFTPTGRLKLNHWLVQCGIYPMIKSGLFTRFALKGAFKFTFCDKSHICSNLFSTFKLILYENLTNIKISKNKVCAYCLQRWKKTCLCTKNPILGKIFAKFDVVLLEK